MLERINSLKKGDSYISTIQNKQIKKIKKRFIPTNSFQRIKNSEIIIICVPTPIDIKKKPDMKYVKNVVKQIDKYVKKIKQLF